MTKHTGMWVAKDLAGNGTTSLGARLATGGLLAHDGGDPLNVRTGVLADGGGPVVTGTSGMSYSIRPHVAVTKMSNLNGPALIPLDSAITVSTDPAPSANSRIDVIWVRQHHVTGDGASDPDTQSEYNVTKGSVSASPAKPAIPTGATELGSARVTAGTLATSGLTFTPGQWTTANGGSLPGPDGLIDTDWIVPAFTSGSGWSNFGSPRATLAYRRKNGEVFLRGMVKSGSGATIFTLPAGFRPTATDRWDVPASTGTAAIEIGAAGDVVVAAYKGGGDNTAVSLAPIRFIAEA